MIPPKWALGIIVAVVGYCLLQPVVNRSFGWQLPSLAEVINGRPDEAKRPERPEETTSPSSQSSSKKTSQFDAESSIGTNGQTQNRHPSPPGPLSPKRGEGEESDQRIGAKSSGNGKPSVATEKPTVAIEKPSVSIEKPSKAAPTDTDDLAAKLGVNGSDLRFGYLKEVGRDRYQSPAGLFYTRGSEEGHRLKHIQRHLADQPSRPGPHGVFEADMPQVLKWIDEAYQKAAKGDRMAKTRREDDSTIYEFTFAKPIGFIGGSDGKRRKNPPTNRLRLVVIDKNVITAFPF